ncbi:MAG TPA: DUF302 domain-containing protein [Prolixibacteraceae bacterium]|jgi:uncharacterized protein (DUF302 family)|nr:DUF302 domain-containing protein [Prolixibacteraceae bacterium]
MQGNQSILEKESLFGFNETVELLTNAATDRGWGNPATHDLQQTLAKSGKSVMPVKVIEICKPEYSGQMLERSDERIVSVMMPCRVSVYQKSDGKIYVATLNVKSFVTTMPDVIQGAMIGAAEELDEIVRAVTR